MTNNRESITRTFNFSLLLSMDRHFLVPSSSSSSSFFNDVFCFYVALHIPAEICFVRALFALNQERIETAQDDVVLLPQMLRVFAQTLGPEKESEREFMRFQKQFRNMRSVTKKGPLGT